MCKSSVHSYQRSILTAEVVHLFTFGFVGVRDSFSIWILPPAVYFYRRSELTEDVYILSTFLFQALLFGWQTSPSILTLRDFAAASPVYSYGAYATFPFYTLDFIITRDYTSLLREITNHYYERLQIIITRDFTSSSREISLHCYERLQIIIWIIHPPSIFTVGPNWRRIHSFSRHTLLPPSILTLRDFVAASPVHSYGGYARGLFYTVIWWLEIGDIRTDGSHYGNNISRHGFHTANKLVNAFKSIKQLKDIDSYKL
jgi:hypothetical protein